MLDKAPADEGTAQGQESLMDIGPALITGAQTFELMQPGQGAFDYPAIAAQARAVWSTAATEHRFDAPLAQPGAMGVGVVALIAL